MDPLGTFYPRGGGRPRARSDGDVLLAWVYNRTGLGGGPPATAAIPRAGGALMAAREFLDVDPRTIRLPTAHSTGADPAKLARQLSRHGTSVAGMPPLFVVRGKDGELQLY